MPKAVEEPTGWVRAGKNVRYQMQGKDLLIKVSTEVPAEGWPESSTGKSFIMASSQGFTTIEECPGLSINFTATVRKR